MPVSPGLTLNELCTRSVIQNYMALTTTLIPPVFRPGRFPERSSTTTQYASDYLRCQGRIDAGRN